jgi:hypothetical protein
MAWEERKSYKEGSVCVMFVHTGGGFKLVNIGDTKRVFFASIGRSFQVNKCCVV